MSLQKDLTTVYPRLEAGEKIRLLTALNQTITLHSSLRSILINEFTNDVQPWLFIKILSLFQRADVSLTDTEKTVISKVKTDHPALKKALSDLL
ncbi:hypothetical protein ACFQRK_23865 [Parapedobacter sp. GCM10030251]|uniref:hypothetical protein n=1 Tax=Parapedobacter sp. GCM10030251 TaxID=3273419 RepID=UPI0036126AE9